MYTVVRLIEALSWMLRCRCGAYGSDVDARCEAVERHGVTAFACGGGNGLAIESCRVKVLCGSCIDSDNATGYSDSCAAISYYVGHTANS